MMGNLFEKPGPGSEEPRSVGAIQLAYSTIKAVYAPPEIRRELMQVGVMK